MRKIVQLYAKILQDIRAKLSFLHIRILGVTVTYGGGWKISVFVRRKSRERFYFLDIRPLIFGIFILVVGFFGFILYQTSDRQTNTLESFVPPEQIGGFGEQKSVDKKQISVEKTIGIGEEDERLKDLLLGLVSEKKVSKPKKSEKSQFIKKIDYRVKPGDTLSKIAKDHNVSIESILGVTKIPDPNRLQVGQTLTIPTRDGFFYQIKKGDRLALILEKHKVSWESFVLENPDLNLDLIRVGDSIFLPGAKPIKPVLSWVIPVASRVITSGYGWRTWPQEAFHKGIDLKAYYTKVRAARSGVVTYAGWLGGYGNAIVIAHDGGYKTLYAHLSRIMVKYGQQVGTGQVIGISGNTGYSFGPHLHFEITRNGENINPTKIFSGLLRRKK